MTAPPQWYPDPDQPGTLRYWDGQAWTDQRAPMPPPQQPGISTWKIITGVGVGILAALAALVVLSGVFGESETDRAIDRADCLLDNQSRENGGYPGRPC